MLWDRLGARVKRLWLGNLIVSALLHLLRVACKGADCCKLLFKFRSFQATTIISLNVLVRSFAPFQDARTGILSLFLIVALSLCTMVCLLPGVNPECGSPKTRLFLHLGKVLVEEEHSVLIEARRLGEDARFQDDVLRISHFDVFLRIEKNPAVDVCLFFRGVMLYLEFVELGPLHLILVEVA